jgi:hypothetical protein
VNVQIVNGEGKTELVNGAGNLVIGYDENAGRTQTGSHNVILGEEQAFSSFGGLVTGYGNTISGREASVSGGALNTASGFTRQSPAECVTPPESKPRPSRAEARTSPKAALRRSSAAKKLAAKIEFEAIP